MEPTNVWDPDYYHRVVDCQYACPAHTNVPGYIRLIAQGRYDDAYMVNWESNVFPGILGRTCDRPCEPACRRTRVEEKPVAICRLKRVAADFRQSKIEILAINGGDGTISKTLTAFINEYGDEPLPKIAILKGGTINVVERTLLKRHSHFFDRFKLFVLFRIQHIGV